MARRRGQGGGDDDRSSFGSSDSDEDRPKPCASRTRRPCRGKTKQSCTSGGLGWLMPCLDIRRRLRSCWGRMSCDKSCASGAFSICYWIYGIGALLLLGLLYYYRWPVWHYISLLIPSSLFKSTSTIVNEALAQYNADKLGLADYALESAGGSILCSSSTYYSRNGALYSIFGVPLWYHTSSPREVIQPHVQPGNCWAMDGSNGYVMIQLSMPIMVTAISLEHIPAQVAPIGRIDSAPKDFSIVGKERNMDSPDMHLGTFHYNADSGNPIQTFEVKDPYCTRQASNMAECGPNKQVYRIIELRILSNYGHKDFTCIYRLRVHGKPISQVFAEQKYTGEKGHSP